MSTSLTNLGIEGLEDVALIGSGGSSRVYRALQSDLDRVVAIKVINAVDNPDVARRFDAERKAMGRLSLHEGIVPVYSSGMTSKGEPYLVMPYYPNGSLQDQIDAGALEWQTAVSYIDAAADTIAAAHDEGIVHLDLKPANILLTSSGAPRIADFGIARLTNQAASTANSSTAFTPAYSAPEAFLDGQTSQASDVYGLGATLWALLVGHPPFLAPEDDTSLMAVIGRVINNPVGDLRHLAPAPICDVIERAMAKDPTHRFGSAREFSHALKTAASSSSAEFGADATAAYGQPIPPPVPVDAATTVYTGQEVDGGMNYPPPARPAAAGTAVGGRPLLEEVAHPVAHIGSGPNGPAPGVIREPLFDFDRFRMGPILVGLLAFVAVGTIGFWSFNRDGGEGTATDGASGSTLPTDPAGPAVSQDGDDPSGNDSATGPGAGDDSGASGGLLTGADTNGGDDSSTVTTVQTPAPTTTEAEVTTTVDNVTTTEEVTTTTEEETTTTEEVTTTTEEETTTTEEPTTTTTVVTELQVPENVTATVVDGESVNLTWDAPSTGPEPARYEIQRVPAFAGRNRTATTSFTDDSVDPGTTYTYTVLAVIGSRSAAAGPVSVEIPEEPEPEPFTATIQAGPVATTSATVIVKASSCATFAVSWDGGGASGSVLWSGPCATEADIAIPLLTPETTYAVSVKATAEDGGSAEAGPIAITTESIPEPPGGEDPGGEDPGGEDPGAGGPGAVGPGGGE